MRVLVTGGSGFIGSFIVEHHLAKRDRVFVVDNISTGSLKNIKPFQSNPHFSFEKADILTWPGLEKIVSSVDRIYHLAAIVGSYRALANPVNVLNTNIMGSQRLFSLVAKNNSKQQIMIASSSSVYGHSKKPLLEETNDLIIKSVGHPLWNYALSKIASEALALAYHRMANISVTIIRLFNTIGPRQTGQYGMVVPRFVQQARANEPITVYGDGNQTRSFCDVRDTIKAIMLLLDMPESNGEIINVGNDKEISIRELAELTREIAKSRSKIIYIPYQDAYGEHLTDISQRHPDLTKLYKLTNFKQNWELKQTLENLINLSAT